MDFLDGLDMILETILCIILFFASIFFLIALFTGVIRWGFGLP